MFLLIESIFKYDRSQAKRQIPSDHMLVSADARLWIALDDGQREFGANKNWGQLNDHCGPWRKLLRSRKIQQGSERWGSRKEEEGPVCPGKSPHGGP